MSINATQTGNIILFFPPVYSPSDHKKYNHFVNSAAFVRVPNSFASAIIKVSSLKYR